MGKMKSLILAGVIASFIVCVPSVTWGQEGTIFSDVQILNSDIDPATDQLLLRVELNSADAAIYGNTLVFVVDTPVTVQQLGMALSSLVAIKGKAQIDLRGVELIPGYWSLVGFHIGK